MDSANSGRARWWRRPAVRLVALTVAVVAVYTLLPALPADAFFQLVAWTCLGVYAAGLRRHRAMSVPLVLFGAGWALSSIGDLLFSVFDHLVGSAPFPSVADVFYLASYPCLAAGLAALVRRSRPDGDRVALIDASIVVVPAAVIGWLWIVEPYARTGTTLTEQAVSAAYPFGDLLCVAVLVRLLASRPGTARAARPALWCLGTGLVTMLVADVWFLAAALHGTYAPSGLSDGLYLVPYVFVAAAAWSPSIAAVGHDLPPSDPALSSRRLVLLAAAALITPCILAVQWWRGAALTVPLVVFGTVLSFLLVIARMATLVDALERSRSELAHDATHDHLTNLANRSLFERRLTATVGRAVGGAVLFIDLDNFKQVNDQLGHQQGDRVLMEVGERLTRSVRSTDVVARISGDEFGVLLPGIDEPTAQAMATRLLGDLSFAPDGDDGLVVTASIGLVTWSADQPPLSLEHVMVEADSAMYRAKAMSGNQVVTTSS